MAAPTFDGANKIISLAPGTTTLDLADLWSYWKNWLLTGNAGFALAMDTVGGNPIDPGAGTLVPLYVFLKNGWKIRPQEANHTLTIIGGTLVVDGGGDPFVATLGTFNVRVLYQQPVQALGYSTAGSAAPTASQVADAVWQHTTGAAVATRLAEAWGRLGLDPSKPLVTGQTQITFGDIVMAMTGDQNSSTVTRQ